MDVSNLVPCFFNCEVADFDLNDFDADLLHDAYKMLVWLKDFILFEVAVITS